MRRSSFICVLALLGTVVACTPPPPTSCHDATAAGVDVMFEGTPNTVDNATAYSSEDGTCTGTSSAFTIVTGDDLAAATDACTALGGSISGPDLSGAYPSIPPGNYSCDIPLPNEPPPPGCHDATAVGADVTFEGPPNTVGNATAYSSDGGSCTGDSAAFTIVTSQDLAAATDVCTALGGSISGLELSVAYPSIPPGNYSCVG